MAHPADDSVFKQNTWETTTCWLREKQILGTFLICNISPNKLLSSTTRRQRTYLVRRLLVFVVLGAVSRAVTRSGQLFNQKSNGVVRQSEETVGSDDRRQRRARTAVSAGGAALVDWYQKLVDQFYKSSNNLLPNFCFDTSSINLAAVSK